MSRREYGVCSINELWSGGVCVADVRILDECSGYRTMMERQAQRLQAAESIRQSACALGNTQECSDATISWQSEMDLYRSFQARYKLCVLPSGSSYPFLRYGFHSYGYATGLRMDPVFMDWSYMQRLW